MKTTPVQMYICSSAHPSGCTLVQLHTRHHSSTYLLSELHKIECIDCQSELAEILFYEKRKNKSIFFFCKKKSLPILLLYPIYILSSKVKHNGSMHKYTQLVMLTHYSPLRGWLPSVTLGHNHNQTTRSGETGTPFHILWCSWLLRLLVNTTHMIMNTVEI
jgi:hypothetical protein